VIHALLERLNRFARGTEDLHLVVVGDGHHDPGVILVPVEVADAISEASVHEKSGVISAWSLYKRKLGDLQLRWPFFRIFITLLGADHAEIPQADTAIVA
jgi:hypothetical protein